MGSENKLLKKFNNNIILNQTLKNHFKSKLKILNIIIGHDKQSIKKILRDYNIQCF